MLTVIVALFAVGFVISVLLDITFSKLGDINMIYGPKPRAEVNPTGHLVTSGNYPAPCKDFPDTRFRTTASGKVIPNDLDYDDIDSSTSLTGGHTCSPNSLGAGTTVSSQTTRVEGNQSEWDSNVVDVESLSNPLKESIKDPDDEDNDDEFDWDLGGEGVTQERIEAELLYTDDGPESTPMDTQLPIVNAADLATGFWGFVVSRV